MTAPRRALPHAWLFAITATLGVLPGVYGLFMSVFTVVLLPPVLIAWTVGCVLLAGYWAYILDRPFPHGRARLWSASAALNGLMSACWLMAGLDDLRHALEIGVWGDSLHAVGAAAWLAFLALVALHAWVRDRAGEAAAAGAVA